MKALLLLFLCALTAPWMARAQTSELPLRPGDRITLTIGGVPPEEIQQISKVYTIAENGVISLLHIQEVKAAGLKPSELQRAVEATYRREEIYTNPTVTISIDDALGGAPSRVVYVVGVMQPGPKPFKPGLTALQAVNAGGGPNPYASMRKAQIIRSRQDGTRQSIPVDLSKAIKDPSLDMVLQPDDQVILPE
ncbi:MAG: polysaccharide biosynthesis/export family protein [Verrucomicrobiales bacterium]|nr:polysaccharide biosynthesis/export family protein [Verrucomicrobiales bacterium]